MISEAFSNDPSNANISIRERNYSIGYTNTVTNVVNLHNILYIS